MVRARCIDDTVGGTRFCVQEVDIIERSQDWRYAAFTEAHGSIGIADKTANLMSRVEESGGDRAPNVSGRASNNITCHRLLLARVVSPALNEYDCRH
jgi:hypothetical protein